MNLLTPKIKAIGENKKIINELDYPSFENFESHRINGQSAITKVQISYLRSFTVNIFAINFLSDCLYKLLWIFI